MSEVVPTDDVVALVREAGEIVRQHYRAYKAKSDSLAITKKADSSPVTAADLAVDAFLTPALEELTGIRVISEERHVPFGERRGWERFWLLDPIDGTKDFIAQSDEFAICLGLVEHGVPTIGIIYGPEVDELYVGERGRVAWFERTKKDGARRERMPYRSPAPPVCGRSRFWHTKSVEDFAREHGLSMEPCGSALKFGRVAAGEYRAYASFGSPHEWDIAAGVAIIEAAGGTIVPHKGKFAWNTESLTAKGFSAWSAGHEPR